MILYLIACVAGTISWIWCAGILTYLFTTGLYKTQKFRQIVYLNSMTITTVSGFLFMIIYRRATQVESLGCLITYQTFMFSSTSFHFSLLSLTCDCLVAVFFPLKYRTIMTAKNFGVTTATIGMGLLGFYVVYPLVAFGKNDYLDGDCTYKEVVPITSYYLKTSVFLIFLINSLIILLNVAIGIGVVLSLLRRREIAASELSLRQSMIKLSLRLVAIVLFNFGFTAPLTLSLLEVRILLESAATFIPAMSLGFFNGLIFFVGDPEIRNRICKRH